MLKTLTQPSIGVIFFLWIFFLKKRAKKKETNLKEWAESLKNIKIHFTKNKLFHKHFSGIFA